jgi:hypothetical protein
MSWSGWLRLEVSSDAAAANTRVETTSLNRRAIVVVCARTVGLVASENS